MITDVLNSNCIHNSYFTSPSGSILPIIMGRSVVRYEDLLLLPSPPWEHTDMLSYKLEASPSLSKGEEQESQFYLSYLLPLGETERGLDFNKGEIRHIISCG